MNVLLTNDDGVYSIGIQTLAKSLKEAGHNLLVVAPDRERSGCGHAMTMDRPVHLKNVNRLFLSADFEAKSCDGTPTDCVIMAIDAIGFRPDIVISGINQGPNLGDDLTYSGTVCAAMEGVIFGYPSIAVSLVMSSTDREAHNDTAAAALMALLDWTRDAPIPEGVLYNVNVPNIPIPDLKGVLVTRKGVRRYVDKIRTVRTPSGGEAYWIGGNIEDDMSDGTDVWAVANNYVSVTPVHMEMTSFKTHKECKESGLEAYIGDKINKYLANSIKRN
jgi:5'-nucleotidase